MNLTKSRDLVCISWTVLYFTDQLFRAVYRLFCKIVNLLNINLKFSGFISDVNCDNPAKFREVSKRRSCILKNRTFQDLVCSLQTGPLMSNLFLILCLPMVSTSCKNFIVVPFVVFEISGGMSPPPPDAIKLSDKVDAINR